MSESVGSRRRTQPEHTFLERMLDGIERAGNKMPDPAILFLVLCGGVIVLSQILVLGQRQATYEVDQAAAGADRGDLLRRLDAADRRRADRARCRRATTRS